MTLAFAGRSLLMAGHPTYVWRTIPPPLPGMRPDLDSTVRSLGVMLSGSRVRNVPPPDLPGILSHVRAIGEPEGDFTVVFAQLARPSDPGQEPTLVGYWAGRTDGASWRSLDRLPEPDSGEPKPVAASQLIRQGQVIAFAVPVSRRLGADVAVYTRTEGRWTLELVPAGFAAYATMTTDQYGRLELLVARPDSTNMPYDSNSLSRFTLAAGQWLDRGFIARGGREPVHHPDAVLAAGTPTIGWVSPIAGVGGKAARALRLSGNGVSRVMELGRGVEDLALVRNNPGPARWVVHYPVSEAGPGQLDLVEWSTDTARVLDRVRNPFAGWMAAFAEGDLVTVVGPIHGPRAEEEVVVSGFLRLNPGCRAQP